LPTRQNRAKIHAGSGVIWGIPVKMRKRTQLIVQFFAVDILAIVLIELVFRLSRFPGLNGIEARFGLRALEIMQNGSVSVHGMNKYTGALFPGIVALVFSTTGVSIFSLRELGALSNWAALAIAMATFWKQGRTPFYLGCAIRIIAPLSLLQQSGVGGVRSR